MDRSSDRHNRLLTTDMVRLLSIALILAFTVPGSINPQTKRITDRYFPDPDIEINTPAFQKKRGFTDYEEMMAYLNEREEKYGDLMSISFIGNSQKGYPIPLVTLQKGSGSEDHLRVWMQGGLHGNEPGSTEGVLMLMDHVLANADQHYLLDRLTLQIVPMANIDGYEKQDRYAANGLDLNRDQTKLVAPESQVLKKTFSDFNPHVALDFHEYRPYRKDYAKLSTYGVTTIYDVMFLYSGNLNVPDTLRHFTKEAFVEPAKRIMDEHELRHHDYFSSTTHLGEIQLSQGATNARSSATSYALSQAVSTLIEVRGVGLGRTSFTRRVYTTFLIGMSYLETAYQRHNDVKQVIDLSIASQQQAVVNSKRSVYPQTVTMIDLDTEDPIDLELNTRDSWLSTPVLTRPRPAGYVIDSAFGPLAYKLELLGLVVERLDKPTRLSIEKYTVVDYTQASQLYEKEYMQDVTTQVTPLDTTLPAGSYLVSLRQKNANLAIEVCEPEAPNSFVSFGQLPTELHAQLPIYRYVSSNTGHH